MSTEKELTKSIIKKLEYWRDYTGTGDEYRRTHDLDCVLTGGDLRADTLFSLWLPLRYAMVHFSKPQWVYWRDYEYAELRPNKRRLKDCPKFLNDMIQHLDRFLDMETEIARKLSMLFELGQQRCNVMLLPKRCWNSIRGMSPYFDYVPHFFADLFVYSLDDKALQRWLTEEKLQPFFINEELTETNIRDLAGTGSPRRHRPADIKLETLLDNYIAVLNRRQELLELQKSV